MTIREAYETSNMTISEIAKYLQVPQRTLQDWIYEKRNPKDHSIADKIMAMSILTPEGRDSLILEDGDWPTVMAQYKIEQARRLSRVGSFRDSFSRSLERVPESCVNVLNPQQLADIVDALNDAYHDGRNDGSPEE